METLKQKEEEEQSVERSVKKTSVFYSFPIEIIEEILSRLPVKSILRSRSVSKQWLSLLSHPSFTKLHITRATVSRRTGLFISAYDKHTGQRHYLSAANDGGPLTRLMRVYTDTGYTRIAPSHVNGLIYYTSKTHATGKIISKGFVVNPSTRRTYKLPRIRDVKSTDMDPGYFFGFDESTREHKILYIREVDQTSRFELFIFSMSSYSWRKINPDPPIGFTWGRLLRGRDGGVCVNGIVHIMLFNVTSFDILAFDFVTEKLLFIGHPHGLNIKGYRNDTESVSRNLAFPSIMKIDGSVGVVVHDPENSEVHIWLLRDYDNRVWVKETIKFPQSWNKLARSYSLSADVNMDDEIVFSCSEVSEDAVIIPVYNRKSKSFRSLQFTDTDQILCSKSLRFCHVKCYVESIISV